MTETLEQRIRRLTAEEVALAPYDPCWPQMFQAEAQALRTQFGPDLIRRIEHFGSTSVPGMAAKPIIDMLIEVASLDRSRTEIAPALEAKGYEYLWRPTQDDRGEPFYAWFIKRNERGERTHHLHMVEASFAEHWRRLHFRDYLIAHADAARAYEEIKLRLAREHPNDRVAYTRGKTEFIAEIMAHADAEREGTARRSAD
jgi:GrpB-like predicted nucleotidyltransferase (UPF0157 family)